MQKEILIIGGGVIGVSAAYFLAKAGATVTVIDKGEIGAGSSHGNAGLLCPCHSTPIAMPGVLSQGLKWLLDAESPFYIRPRLDWDLIRWLRIFRSHCNQMAFETAVPLIRDLQRASLDLYRQLIAQEKLSCNFSQTGGLALFLTNEGLKHGTHEVKEMREFGLKMTMLDAAAAHVLEPAISPEIIGAIHYKEDAYITPHLFMRELQRAATDAGIIFLPQTEVLNFDMGNRQITAVQTTRGTIKVKQVVLTAGAWSAPIAQTVGAKFPMQPAKGYSITVQPPAITPQHYLYLSEARIAITPMGKHLRFAGTLELAGFDFTINTRRVNAILRAANTYLADETKKEVVEIWRGMRPCSPDGLPFIGRSNQITNLVIGTGHATLGMSMGPVTGKLLAEIVEGKRPFLPLAPFQIERFG